VRTNSAYTLLVPGWFLLPKHIRVVLSKVHLLIHGSC